MERMTESRRDDLCEDGTKCARRIGGRVRLHPQIAVDGTREMTDFVNQSTLLCRDQQQQETQRFEHVSHSSWYRLNPIEIYQANRIPHANRIRRNVHNLWYSCDRFLDHFAPPRFTGLDK